MYCICSTVYHIAKCIGASLGGLFLGENTVSPLLHCVTMVQVIEGGDLDINFVVSDPDHHPIVMEPHSMDGLHGLDVRKTGEYEICLDNSFSRMTGEMKCNHYIRTPP